MKWILQRAVAARRVGGLEEMETMWAEPVGVRWVRWGDGGGLSGRFGVVERGLLVVFGRCCGEMREKVRVCWECMGVGRRWMGILSGDGDGPLNAEPVREYLCVSM